MGNVPASSEESTKTQKKSWGQRLRRLGWRLFRVALLAYCGFAVLIYALQTKMVFPGAVPLYRTPATLGWDFEEVLEAVPGGETHGWYIPLEDAPGVILFSHGNGENVSDALEFVRLFRKLGFSALVYDYGGYGNSTGKPSELRAYEDIRAMWRFLTEQKGIAPGRIALMGRSLGGGATAQLAAEVRPGAIILDSTFTSAVNLGSETFPFLPVRRLLKHRFESIEKVPEFEAPLLVIHSRDDTLIPPHHGKALFDAAREPKRFAEVRGGHNEAIFVSRGAYEQVLSAFLEPLFPRGGEKIAP